jgi:hypothetical protein
MCSARTDNQILFVFALPTDVAVHVNDELTIANPSLDGVLRIANVTRRTSFDTSIKSNDVHDLRLPTSHGTCRTPSLTRLLDNSH